MLPSVSCVMIVKNEEEHLEACLSSVRPVVDEVIIVDTGSQDATLEIAKRFADRIEHFTWCDDFSAARNYATSFASQAWILSLDADESFPKWSVQPFQDLLRQVAEKPLTANFLVRHYMPKGQEPAVVEAYQPKFFPNRKEIQWKGVVHETFTVSSRALGLEHHDIPIVLEHSGFQKDPSFVEKKEHYYLKLLIQKIKDEPENGAAWGELGMQFLRFNQYGEALRAFEQAVSKRPDWLQPWQFLIQTLERLSRKQDALRVLDAAVQHHPQLEEYRRHLLQS